MRRQALYQRAAALLEDGLEGVRPDPGFEKGEHGTWTAGPEKVRSRQPLNPAQGQGAANHHCVQAGDESLQLGPRKLDV